MHKFKCECKDEVLTVDGEGVIEAAKKFVEYASDIGDEDLLRGVYIKVDGTPVLVKYDLIAK